MKRRLIVLSLILFTGFFQLPTVWAHGPVHELIAKISIQIKESPSNAALYLQRGEYHRIDENFDAAYSDFQQALALDSSLQLAVDFQLGALFNEQGHPQAGLFHMQRFLQQNPQHIKALILEASLYKQAGQDSLSVARFAQALSLSKEPRPHHYLEIAKATLRADSTNFEGARHWLSQGEEKLGFNIVLRTYAIELAQAAGEYDAAIAQVDDIIARLSRHEKWLLQKALILEAAGRTEAAIQAYEQTLTAIEKLPRRNRSTRIVSEWQSSAHQGLARLR